jgi:hypothetical protein
MCSPLPAALVRRRPQRKAELPHRLRRHNGRSPTRNLSDTRNPLPPGVACGLGNLPTHTGGSSGPYYRPSTRGSQFQVPVAHSSLHPADRTVGSIAVVAAKAVAAKQTTTHLCKRGPPLSGSVPTGTVSQRDPTRSVLVNIGWLISLRHRHSGNRQVKETVHVTPKATF